MDGVNSNVLKSNFFSRYKILIVSVLIFLLFIIAVLGVNLYSAKTISRDVALINFSSYMRDLNNEISRDLFNIRLSYGEDPNTPHMKSTIERLRNNVNIFDSNIKSMLNGGELIDADNQKIKIGINEFKQNNNELKVLISEWKEIKISIDTYLSKALSPLASLTDLDIAINQVQYSESKLLNNTNSIATEIKNSAFKRAQNLNFLQISGLAGVVLFFIIFIFFILRRLIRSDIQLEESRRETTEIMDTVQEGLFLIDENLTVGSQQSKALATILPGIQLEDQKFGSVLKSILSERDISDTQSYIEQLFKPRVKESLIRSLNPLSRIQVFFDNGQGTVEDRYLKFDFNRVYEDKDIKRVLVSVADITKSVELENRLEREREENNRQIELLVKVLRIDPEILASYMNRGKETTQTINNILRRPDVRNAALRQKIEDIFREIHSFKGESSALELDQFVVLSQEMESKLRTLREKNELSGDDFLSVAVSLDAIIEQLNILETLQDRLRNHQKGLSNDIGEIREATMGNNNQAIENYFIHFAEQVASRNYKLVNVIVDGFDSVPFNSSTTDIIKSIVIQLIRNAVVHGIETPERRKGLQKSRQGNLAINLRKRNGFYDLIIEDDGSGIDTEALKNKLSKLPDYQKELHKMTHEEILRTIFLSGISTSDSVTEDAGQGVGMDVVLDRIRSLGAKIAISSKPNEFTRFVIRIPQ